MMRLEVRDLSFEYHRGKTVLDGISFAYSAPDVLCILGENGMGKSTIYGGFLYKEFRNYIKYSTPRPRRIWPF